MIVIATAQLMLVLDDSVANIALPSIQRELAVPASALPWVINAYVLAFGALLLFGGGSATSSGGGGCCGSASPWRRRARR